VVAVVLLLLQPHRLSILLAPEEQISTLDFELALVPANSPRRIAMKRAFPLVVLTVLAFTVVGQLAVAQPHHYTVKVVPRAQAEAVPESGVAKNLYGTSAVFAFSPYTQSSSPTNSDGTDLWPCFGSYTSSGGTSSENPDCPTIGDPSQGFPAGGVVLGGYAYTWSLSDCNATSTTAPPCGQTETWYEDDSGDSTDELTYTIEATQGSTVIADSGTVVFGPNTFGGQSPAANIVISGDENFGDMGVKTGPNNGNCDADFDYPLTSAAFPGSTYVIAAGKTCGAAVSGPVSLTATTEVATPKYTKSTSSSVCGSVGTPCYTVKFTKKYSVTQKWTINLQ
jgi:hypothetical protein